MMNIEGKIPFKGSILVVDDTPANLQILAGMLSQQGYKVRMTTNGTLALKSVEAVPPDLILLDIMMPGLDGYEVCKHLKVGEKTRDIPIIFISAKNEVLDKVEAFAVGGVDYITKPFKLEEVVARVENQLRIGRLQKQLVEQNARLQEEIRERQKAEMQLQLQLERSHLLQQITEEIRSDLDTEKIFQKAAARVGEAFGASRVLLHACSASPAQKIPIVAEYLVPGYASAMNLEIPVVGNSHAEQLLARDKAIACEDVYREPIALSERAICQQLQVKSALAARTSCKGEPNGIIALHQCDRLRKWTEAEIELLEAIAAQLGIAIAQAKLLEQEKHSNARLDRKNLQLSQEIGDRRAAESALRESERKYRALVEASQDAIWSLDALGRYTFLNPAVKQIYGWEPEEMVGRHFTDFESPEQAAKDIEVFSRLLNGESVFQEESRQLAKDGRAIDLLFNAIPLRDEGGNIVGATGTAANISDRKQREEALKLMVEGTASSTGREFFRDCVRYLAEVLQVRYAIVTEFANDEKSRVRASAFWTGSDWCDGIEYDLTHTPCANVLEGMACYYPERLQELFPDDTELAELNAQSYWGLPLKNARGHVLGHLAVLDTKPMQQDAGKESILKIFAARVGAEVERKQIEEALIESEKRLSTIVATNADGLIIVDKKGMVRFVNPAAGNLFGRESEELLGQWFGIPFVNGGISEIDLIHRPRGLITAEIRIAEIIWEGANAYLASLRDITERKQTEREIRLLLKTTQAISRASDLNSALSEILRLICTEIGWDVGEAWLPSEDGTVLEYSPGWYAREGSFEEFHSYSQTITCAAGVGLPGRVWATGQPEWIEDISATESSDFQRRQIAGELGLHAGFGVPIVAGDSLGDSCANAYRVVAVLVFFKQARSPKNRRSLELASAVAAQLGALIQRKQAEAALRSSQRRYRTLAEASPVCIFHADLRGDWLYVNQRWSEITGVNAELALGSGWGSTLHPEDRDRVEAEWYKAVGEKISFKSEYRFARPDGTTCWVIGQAVPEIGDSSEVTGYVGTITDISDRKQAEIEILSTRARQQHLLASSPAVIYSCKVSGDFAATFISENVTSIFGYPAGNFTENPSFWADGIHPEDVKRVFAELTHLFERGHHSQEYRFRHADGQYRWVRDELKLVRDASGNPIEAVGSWIDITSRKQAEMELLSTRARLEYLLAYSPAIIFSCQAGGNYGATFISANVSAVLGYETREFLEDGNFWASRLHPDDRERIWANFPQLWETGLYTHEYRFLHKDGQYRWMYAQLRLVKDEAGNPVECVGYWADISDRVRAEESLRASEATNRALLNAIPDLMFRALADGTYIDFKPAKGIETWLPAEVFVGKKVEEVLPPDLARKILAAYERALASGQTQIVEYQLEFAERTCDYEARVVACGSNEIIAMVRDISDRKQAEQVLRESAEREKAIATVIQRMRQSLDIQTIFAATTSELRQVLKCDRVAVYAFNPDWSGQVVAESVAAGWRALLETQNNDPYLTESSLEHHRCAARNLGSEPYEIEDTYLQATRGGAYSRGTNYLCVADIYQAGFTSCYVNLLEHFQARAYVIVPIFRGRQLWGLLASYHNSGPRFWGEAEIKIAIQIGNQLGVALQQAELLAQTQRQSAALQQALLAADAANRAKSEFLANMSHELRTPLNAILGFTQVMVRDRSVTAQQQENLRIINRAGEHLLDLINDILEMSKIEAGRTALKLASFDLIKLVEDLHEMLRSRALSKGLQFICHIAPDVPQFVRTDEAKLRQVLINILGNAIKFTEKGSIALRVRGQRESGTALSEESVSASLLPAPDTRLFFEIEDTGPGIRASEIDRLFEPFAQTETGRKSQQGTGLGLPISRKFVQLMGGEIAVSSTPSRGSLFAFDIAASIAGASEVQTIQPQRKVVGLAPNQPQYRILVVDDRPESRLLLITLFTSIGFAVREAENGLQAIAVWESWEPHLIVMDMRMPVMDGYEATQQIKAHLKGQATAIIALTASAFEEERKMVLSAGCDDFIRKPFKEEVLLDKVSQHLGVVYVCETETKISEPSGQKSAESLSDDELRRYLSQMPAAWLARIRSASRDGSDDEILEAIEEIPPAEKALAIALTDLANNFQFQKLMELTREGER